jgi:hypothetical protein
MWQSWAPTMEKIIDNRNTDKKTTPDDRHPTNNNRQLQLTINSQQSTNRHQTTNNKQRPPTDTKDNLQHPKTGT